MPRGKRRTAISRRIRYRHPWQAVQVTSSIAIPALAMISTGKTFTYANLFANTFTTNQTPIMIKRVTVQALGSGPGATTLIAELVGLPFTSATGGTGTETACASRIGVTSIGQKLTLICKPRLSGNFNWIDPTSTNQMLIISGKSVLGSTVELAIKVYFVLDRQAGYSVLN